MLICIFRKGCGEGVTPAGTVNSTLMGMYKLHSGSFMRVRCLEFWIEANTNIGSKINIVCA